MAQERTYRFSAEKNASLKAMRGVNFDDVIYCLENDFLLDTINHTSSKYPHQKMFVIELNRYAYAVPFIQNGNEFFLKTVYPNRLLAKRYLKGKTP